MSLSSRAGRSLAGPLCALLCAALLVLATSACARSPQVVVLSPTLSGPPGKIAAPTTVELGVRDDRSTRVIGSRGGLYAETSTITTEDDIAPGLRKLLAEKLEQQGYTVVPPGSGGEVTLDVALQKLTYETGGSVLTEIKVSSSIGVTVRKGADTLTSRFETNHREEFATAPDDAENAELINMVLGRTLDEMLTDQELRAFIAG